MVYLQKSWFRVKMSREGKDSPPPLTAVSSGHFFVTVGKGACGRRYRILPTPTCTCPHAQGREQLSLRALPGPATVLCTQYKLSSSKSLSINEEPKAQRHWLIIDHPVVSDRGSYHSFTGSVTQCRDSACGPDLALLCIWCLKRIQVNLLHLQARTFHIKRVSLEEHLATVDCTPAW